MKSFDINARPALCLFASVLMCVPPVFADEANADSPVTSGQPEGAVPDLRDVENPPNAVLSTFGGGLPTTLKVARPDVQPSSGGRPSSAGVCARSTPEVRGIIVLIFYPT